MGYKGKDDRGKGKRRVHERLIGNSRQKTAKQIVGENRCNDISFRPLSGYCQKRKDGVSKTEFFPKCGIYASFGKNSTYGNIKDGHEFIYCGLMQL